MYFQFITESTKEDFLKTKEKEKIKNETDSSRTHLKKYVSIVAIIAIWFLVLL